MTPYEQAEQVALKLGMNFHKVLMEHFAENSYVYSSPDCFMLAVDAWREFGEARHEMAVFVTLAVGKLSEFIAIDPLRERRKWLGYCREDGGEIHWIDYQKLRPGPWDAITRADDIPRRKISEVMNPDHQFGMCETVTLKTDSLPVSQK